MWCDRVGDLRRERLPPIEAKPFQGVRANVDFLEKNRNAAKLLTKSQSQARIIQSRIESFSSSRQEPETSTKKGRRDTCISESTERTGKPQGTR